MNTILIIGDMFAAFANGCKSFTKEQFFQLPDSFLNDVDQIIIGQGVRPMDLRFIYSFLADRCLLSGIEVEEYLSSKACPSVVHKRVDKNVMITVPRQIDDNLFSSHLVVEDGCAELSDHVTGVHMQGMLFAEAARQTYMAVFPHIAQKFNFENKECQHALKEIQVKYRKFLYPMPIEILLEIRGGKYLRKSGIFFHEVVVKFRQLDEIGVEIECKATTHDRKVLVHMEEIGATRQLDKLLAVNAEKKMRPIFAVSEV